LTPEAGAEGVKNAMGLGERGARKVMAGPAAAVWRWSVVVCCLHAFCGERCSCCAVYVYAHAQPDLRGAWFCLCLRTRSARFCPSSPLTASCLPPHCPLFVACPMQFRFLRFQFSMSASAVCVRFSFPCVSIFLSAVLARLLHARARASAGCTQVGDHLRCFPCFWLPAPLPCPSLPSTPAAPTLLPASHRTRGPPTLLPSSPSASPTRCRAALHPSALPRACTRL
jgi:hypothetical protein